MMSCASLECMSASGTIVTKKFLNCNSNNCVVSKDGGNKRSKVILVINKLINLKLRFIVNNGMFANITHLFHFTHEEAIT